jgi:protein-tyrosine phosphatase
VVLEGSARQVRTSDFQAFDVLIALDSANLSNLRALAPGDEERSKVRMLRESDPASAGSGDLDVPDPYYGAGDGFAEVFELVRAACEGLLAQIQAGEIP